MKEEEEIEGIQVHLKCILCSVSNPCKSLEYFDPSD
jgi:hypothetical protein